MGKLTAKYIEHQTPPKDKEYRKADGEGLFLRVRPSGAKSWLFCFRLGSDRTWLQMTLGSLKDVSLKEARDFIKPYRKLVSEGIDPRTVKVATKAENIRAITMQTLFDAWIEHLHLAKEVTTTWVKRHQDRWRLHLEKSLGGILAKDVTRAHLAAALDMMMRKGIREETRKALTTLNLMLDYGLKRHYLDQNPARILKPKDFAATAGRPRERVLSLQELRALWGALDQACTLKRGNDKTPALTLVTVAAIKLLILTGARRSEVAGMRWGELRLDQGIWHLPSDRTTNRQAHTIYLSSLAVELIQALQPLSGDMPYVFCCRGETTHIHQDTLTGVIYRLRGSAKAKHIKSIDAYPLADIPAFSIHDLRRTAATSWGEYLKVTPHVIERMLNHQPQNKLIATYQRAGYADEQKSAWSDWGKLIEHQLTQRD
jgi:integrase